MPKNFGHVTVEVHCGPVLMKARRTLALVEAALGLIPEWHGAERAELEKELKELKRVICLSLKRNQ